MKVNIAIDGPSGAGKSTVSKQLAEKLNYTFINSGSIYRAVALNAINAGADLKNHDQVISTLELGMVKLRENDTVFLKGEDVSLKIRAEYVSQSAATVAKIQEVRNFVVDFIQHMTKKSKGFIIDGRDTTFRIMPHAEVKIFLWADPEERAKRRWQQNKQLGYETNFEEVLYDVKKRDAQDMNREVDPLHKTEDSILIDCTHMTREEVIDKIVEIVNSKIKEQNA
ncbi:(d)CMP kinase [Mycoplasmopsis gallinacea]|uniref:Cytidylate kinase n=1 Tax=Mycoplasmopsis gallinacea TaxID=29556 RepID=A0A0D5ZJU8_9BACT|nr:(d)CMP kinase [Mycoplasmopsis gallinacea]AKA50193.1 cytidylate kinase [Mycoplasmopsis gallinacea]QIW62085.1 (d)CMP kinase [Mycoplasmopsis gallinacea]